MSEPIKAGDLVAVVHPSPCCGHGDTIGLIFRVREVCLNVVGRCQRCGHVSQESIACDTYRTGYQFYRLQKLNGPKQRVFIERKRGIVA